MASHDIQSVVHENIKRPSGTMSRKEEIVNGLLRIGAPLVVIALVIQLASVPGIEMTPNVDFAEFYAGMHEVTRAQRQAGRRAVAYEINIAGDYMNILSNVGFALALHLMCRLNNVVVPVAANLHAPVCSSWIFLSRGTTRRSLAFPAGDPRCKIVQEGNQMLARTMSLIMLSSALGLLWILEQPVTSLFQAHAGFQRFLKIVPTWRHHIRMKNFGAPTDKETFLFCNFDFISDIDRFACPSAAHDDATPKEMVKRFVGGDGRMKVCGGRDLKSSQTYPAGFGQAIVSLQNLHRDKLDKAAADARIANRRRMPDFQKYLELAKDFNENEYWTGQGNFEGVLEFLRHAKCDQLVQAA